LSFRAPGSESLFLARSTRKKIKKLCNTLQTREDLSKLVKKIEIDTIESTQTDLIKTIWELVLLCECVETLSLRVKEDRIPEQVEEFLGRPELKTFLHSSSDCIPFSFLSSMIWGKPNLRRLNLHIKPHRFPKSLPVSLSFLTSLSITVDSDSPWATLLQVFSACKSIETLEWRISTSCAQGLLAEVPQGIVNAVSPSNWDMSFLFPCYHLFPKPESWLPRDAITKIFTPLRNLKSIKFELIENLSILDLDQLDSTFQYRAKQEDWGFLSGIVMVAPGIEKIECIGWMMGEVGSWETHEISAFSRLKELHLDCRYDLEVAEYSFSDPLKVMSQILEASVFPKLRKIKLVIDEDRDQVELRTFKKLCELRMIEFDSESQAIAI
jgi:hypothetical protein